LELDYTREASALRHFRTDHSAHDDIVLPEIIEPLLRSRLLVTTWIEGESIDRARHFSVKERSVWSRALVRIFLDSVLVHRSLHGDPNPGNYRFLAEGAAGLPAVGLLDFGAMHSLRAETATALADAVCLARDQALDLESAWQVHVALGFAPKDLEPLRQQLPSVLRCLLAPLLTRGPFDLATWRPGPRLATLLGDQRLAYRSAAAPEFIFFIRSWHGLVRYLRALRSPVNWHDLFDAACRRRAEPEAGALCVGENTISR
jgi:hypothetical protein